MILTQDLIKDALMDPLGENTMSTSNTIPNNTTAIPGVTTAIPGVTITGEMFTSNTTTSWSPDDAMIDNEHRSLLEQVARDATQRRTTLVGTPYTNNHNPFEAQRGSVQGVYTDAIDNSYMQRGGVNERRVRDLEEELNYSQMEIAKLKAQIEQDRKETEELREILIDVQNKIKLLMEV